MADRPIIFSGPMVQALLDGRKTQTRRLASSPLAKVKPGDRLWVRERTMCVRWGRPLIDVRYDADGLEVCNLPLPQRIKTPSEGKRLSMGCYREVSRLTLAVEAVRLMPLQAISEADALAEGVMEMEPRSKDGMRHFGIPGDDGVHPPTAARAFGRLWESLHGADGWASNPIVAALTFRVVRANVDALEAPHAAE